jgi:hypothetical protein
MSSSTEITGGEGVISLRLPLVGGARALGVEPENPDPTPRPLAGLGLGGAAVPGGQLAAVTPVMATLTMKSRGRAAKSVQAEIPPLRGG